MGIVFIVFLVGLILYGWGNWILRNKIVDKLGDQLYTIGLVIIFGVAGFAAAVDAYYAFIRPLRDWMNWW